MSASDEGKLYSPALLSLATELAEYPLSKSFQFAGSDRSRTCGSTIDIGIDLDSGGRIASIGMQVAACAVGQASAALLAREAMGKSIVEIETTYGTIANWLSGAGGLPDWPGIEVLEPAKEYAGRHEALLLPWKAASSALCKPVAAS